MFQGAKEKEAPHNFLTDKQQKQKKKTIPISTYCNNGRLHISHNVLNLVTIFRIGKPNLKRLYR